MRATQRAGERENKASKQSGEHATERERREQREPNRRNTTPMRSAEGRIRKTARIRLDDPDSVMQMRSGRTCCSHAPASRLHLGWPRCRWPARRPWRSQNAKSHPYPSRAGPHQGARMVCDGHDGTNMSVFDGVLSVSARLLTATMVF